MTELKLHQETFYWFHVSIFFVVAVFSQSTSQWISATHSWASSWQLVSTTWTYSIYRRSLNYRLVRSIKENRLQIRALVDLRGVLWARPPTLWSNLFHFHAVFAKKCQNKRLRLLPLSSAPSLYTLQEGSRIKDQGFPRGGGANSWGGRQHTILLNFPKNCMKLKEFGPRGGVPRAPLRSATAYLFWPICK